MVRAGKTIRSITAYLAQHEAGLQEAFKGACFHDHFSVYGTVRAQARNRKLLLEHDFRCSAERLLRSWDMLDTHVGGGACLFEQARMRAWALGMLGQFEQLAPDLQYIGVHDVEDMRSSDLANIGMSRLRERLERALSRLSLKYPTLKALGNIELSAFAARAGLKFLPHAHVLVHGVPKNDLYADFGQVRGKIRIVKIGDVVSAGIAHDFISCIFKYRPRFIAPSKSGLLTGYQLAQWLQWMARFRPEDLLILKGMNRTIRREFRCADTQFIFEQFLRRHRQLNVQTVPSRLLPR